MEDYGCIAKITQYNNVKRVKDINQYAGEVELDTERHNNRPVKNGIVKCSYYAVTVNGKRASAYSTRTANGAHSFCYIEVEKTKEEFYLDIKISALEDSKYLYNKKPKCEILPLKSGVKPTVEKGSVQFTIEKFGDYTVIFNGQHLEPITFLVVEKYNLEKIFGNYRIEYVVPDDYSKETTKDRTRFYQGNTVYYFKKGLHIIDEITLPSNSIMYLEDGAYLKVVANSIGNKSYALSVIDKKNVKILGRGLIDFSACCGGETYDEKLFQNKSSIIFNRCEKVSFEGITVINSMSWTLNFFACKDVYVNNILFFGYRVWADGVMLSDCQNGLIENSFIRTGDDAFETKSFKTDIDAEATDNILFRNNTCWTDKANGYGCVYESLHPTRNVRFENCSVGFANGNWSKHLGCCSIQLGEVHNPNVTENIVFDNIEIYSNNNQGAINCFIGGSGGRGDGAGTIQNIHFKNIEVKYNHSYAVNLQTWDNAKCFINDIYLENVISNGIKLTEENKREFVCDNVVGGYDFNKLKIK